MTKPPEEPTMSDVLARADADHHADVMATAIETLEQEASDAAPPAIPTDEFVYNTETTEVARTFTGQIERLSRLIKEDDEEIAFNEKERDRLMHELQLRFEAEADSIIGNCRQSNQIVIARRKDRANARGAVQKVVDALQEGKQ